MIRVCKVYPSYYISFPTNFDALLGDIIGVNCNFNKVSYLRYLQNFQCIEIELDGINSHANSTLLKM